MPRSSLARTLRSTVRLAGLTVVGVLAPSTALAKEAGVPPVVFLAPADGPDAVAAQEVLFGLRPAIAERLPGQETAPDAFALVERPFPPDADLLKDIRAARKAGAVLVLAYAPHGRTAALEAAAHAAKIPLVVASPEATERSLDGRRKAFWAGGVPPQDEALQGMDYLLQPLGSVVPLVVHDGSPRGADAAAATAFFRHPSQTVRGPIDVASLDGPALAALVSEGVDGLLYLGGPAGAERVLGVVAAAAPRLPVLLGQGGASAAVPTFHAGAAPTAWSMEARFFEDRGGTGADERAVLEDAAKASGVRVLANHERGHRIGRWLRTAFATAGPGAEAIVTALHAVEREDAGGKPVFERYGWASLARLDLWRSAPVEVEKEPACHRRKDTRVPVQGMPHVGFFSAKRFAWVPGSTHVWVHWAEGQARTIETDLFKVGLNTKGYEQDLEERVLDDLLGRVLSRLNRLFLRNPDGTAIPGVSYDVSFSPEPPGDEVKGRRLEVIIGGDDPAAGGRAFGNTALVFSTYLERTMYSKHKLDPPLSAADRSHMAGGYVWDTSAAENIRNGAVRSLVDGYSQGMALTGAHEIGHLCGCGHDTASPRSIMNVAEGGGLDFDWAEWIPEHARNVEKALKRVPVGGR